MEEQPAQPLEGEGEVQADKVGADMSVQEGDQEESVEEVEQRTPLESIEYIVNKPIMPWLILTDAQKADITRAFNFLDQEGNGLVSAENFKIAIKAMGYEVTSEELKRMISSVGEKHSGSLSVDDFITLIMRKIAEKDSEFDIVKSFLHFDVEDNDFITVENMRIVVDALGDDLNDEEILEMFEAADEDADGVVSKEEFVKMLSKCVTLVTH